MDVIARRFLLKRDVIIVAFAGASSAFGQTPDVYYDVQQSGTIANVNGAIIFTADSGSTTGTGTFGGFLTLGGNGLVNQGISANGVSTGPTPNLFADVTASQTSVMLTSVLQNAPTHSITLGGSAQNYYVFYFDLNEPATVNGRYISLDSLTIYSSAVTPGTDQNPTVWADSLAHFTGSATDSGTGYVGANPTLRWSLDTLDSTDKHSIQPGGNNSVLIDTSVTGSGSGKGDMYVLVPTSAFSDMMSGQPNANQNLYFHASFGEAGVVGGKNYGSHGGFAEVGMQTGAGTFSISLPGNIIAPTAVPETSPSAALGVGLAAAGWLRSRRRRSLSGASV